MTISPRLKPVAALLIAAFPMLSHATPSISATGYYQFNGYVWNPSEPVNLADSFTQLPTTGAFNQAINGAPNPNSNWISSQVSAASDNAGHFGTSVQNSFAFPQSLTLRAGSSITLTDTITNHSASSQSVAFNFQIDQLAVTLFKGIEMSQPITNSASFSATIAVNGTSVWQSSFAAHQVDNEVVGWSETGTLGLSNNPGPWCTSGAFMSCDFAVSNVSQSLNLGSLAANESLTVTYSVQLETETNAYGGSSSIFFSDPANIAAGNLGNDAPISASLHFAAPVPEPEQAGMLLAGLALVGGMAKRRRKVC